MVVQHNMQALNANRMLGVTTGLQAKSTEKLSSGYKINRAADDAAGLSISEKMRKQIKGLDQASTNAQDGISAVQTAEGALTEVHSMLQRMNELAVQASNGTNSESDRQSIQDEIDQLTTEIDRVAETTKFNETYLLKGNGKNTTVKIDAKDAGIAGALTGVGTGNATFKMDELKTGEQIVIGSKGYTIGSTVDEVKGAIDAATVKDGDKVTINGTAYTVTSGEEDTTENLLTKENIKKLISDGDKVTIGSNKYVAMVDGTGVKAEEVLEAAELDADYKVTVSGGTLGSKEVTITTASLSAAATDKVIIDGKEYTVTSAATAGTGEITVADAAGFEAIDKGGAGAYATTTALVSNLLDDGYTVSVKDDAGATVTFTDGAGKEYASVTIGTTILSNDMVGDNDASVITADKAYELIAKELEAAGSIGADPGKEATITKVGADKDELFAKADGKVTFEIKEGEVDTKQGLQFTLHVGADADENNKIALTIDAMDSTSLGISGLNLVDNTGAKATYAIDSIADAVAKVSAQRSALGAIQNRLEHTIANLDNVVENTTSAESSIRDTDMAAEMVNYSKNNILAQAGQAMLAQANTSTQGVLSLLG